MFDGFPAAAFAWFEGIEADNTREWFSEHRSVYDEAVRGPFEEMLDELAEEFGGEVKVFRQNRDIRFSPDRSPYKTQTYGLVQHRPDSTTPLYAQVAAAGLYAATGCYAPASDQLARMREAVADEASGPALERAMRVATDAGLETFGEALKTAPRGYPRDHPRINLLRHKSVIAGHRLAPGPDGIGRDAALAHVRETWAACGQLNAWLDAHVGESELPPPTRFGRR